MSTHVGRRDRQVGTGPGQTSPVDVDATLIYYARLRPATNNQVSNSTRNANESTPKTQPTAQAKRFFLWATRERATIWGSICDGCRLKLSAKWGQAANLVGPKHTQRQARRYPPEFHLLIRFLHGEKIRFVFRLRKREVGFAKSKMIYPFSLIHTIEIISLLLENVHSEEFCL